MGDHSKESIPNVELVSQDGKRVRFLDLLEGRVVVVSFIYTTCAFVCPILGEQFSKLQTVLGDRLNRDINLISISTDVKTDTPERLKAWSRNFGARPGWTLLTGKQEDVDRLTVALVGYQVGKNMHEPVVLLGNYDRGRWVTALGYAAPEKLLELAEEISK